MDKETLEETRELNRQIESIILEANEKNFQ